jgi:hypothetical protein
VGSFFYQLGLPSRNKTFNTTGRMYNKMFRYRYLILVFVILLPKLFSAQIPNRARTAVKIPDIPGYKTLKCDFHIHTVFSDGTVWPHIRAEEAWREGLDAIAITDHIEYQPHKEDLPTKHNRSYEIAKPHGDALKLFVIRGSEITRKMPPGHLNAIFLENVEPLDKVDWRDAINEAYYQGAFIFWNHPGWRDQQPDGVAKWYPEHSELLAKGLLHGIEVVNSWEYYPEAHRWCIDKKLTMLSNSDIHNPLNLDYRLLQGDHRPITLVFAKDASMKAIKNALFDRQTAVYWGNTLIGDEKFLKPIFENSIRIVNPNLTIKGTGRAYLQIENQSDISYKIVRENKLLEISIPDSLILQAGKTVIFEITGIDKNRTGTLTFDAPYRVKNLRIAPEQGLPIKINFEVRFLPEEK